MSLDVGQTISFYEVLGALGAGGMGEVYRARDTRLHREVALKVLPDALVENEEHLARFEREARLLASLNHPNVATIYGVDHVDKLHFLALELVPGQTLTECLADGAMPIDDALAVARQVAEGLQAAHDAGIVHRDLKPANIILRPDGNVKVLDFGLAKRPKKGEETEGEKLTQAFQVMGTPGYLSPEQARGEEADKRSDIWSFGCILYECLTGERAFGGDTVGECIRRIFEETPNMDALPRETPATVRILIARCLSRDLKQRLRDIRDVKLLLEDAPTAALQIPIPTGSTAEVQRYRIAFAALAALLLVAGGWGMASLFRPDRSADPRPAATTAATRHVLALPPDATLGWRGTTANLSKLGKGSPLLDMSPDSRRVAYCVDMGDRSELHVHDVGTFESRALPDTEDARGPFFSPDGSWLGFFAGNTVQIVSLEGGGAQDICQVTSPTFSACYMPDGRSIVYAIGSGLWQVPLSPRGPPVQLTAPRTEDGEVEHSSPAALDDRTVLFTVSTGTGAHVAMLSLETGAWRTVIRDGTSAHFLADGRLVYAQDGGLRVLRFDPASADEVTISEPILDGVYTTPSPGGMVIAHFAMSADGTLVYAPRLGTPQRSAACWIDRKGKRIGEPIAEGPGDWKHPRLGPGGKRFAFDILADAGTKDVHVFEFDRKMRYPATTDGISVMSAWSPDGQLTVRCTHPLGRLRLVDPATRKGRELHTQRGLWYADSWSRDGTLFCTVKRGNDWSLFRLRDGDAAATQLEGTARNARFAQISPNGKWLAYVAEEEPGRPDVFVQPYPALDRIHRVSTAGGGEPLWSKEQRGGLALYYRHAGAMFLVSIQTEPFGIGVPEELFYTPAYDGEPRGHQHYDVSADGRFLMIVNEGSVPDRLHVTRDWTAASD